MDPNCLRKKLRKIVILILSPVSKKISLLCPWRCIGNSKRDEGLQGQNLEMEKLFHEGKIKLLAGWVGVCGGGGGGVGGWVSKSSMGEYRFYEPTCQIQKQQKKH